MSSKKRKYELKVRAERQQQTRERIVAACAALHEQVGPARTTVAEIARRAGVQRLTVYNNFPDEKELYAACQGHFYAAHPQPDPTPAFALEDPAERLQAVLGGLYAWYRDGRQTIANVRRDRGLVPAMDAMLSEGVDRQLAALGEALVAGWSPSDDAKRRLSVTIAVALDFWTWERMADMGLDDAEAAELMTDIAVCAVTAGTRRARQSARPRPGRGESARKVRRQTMG
jgi:AcrR family transcriptional regulator